MTRLKNILLCKSLLEDSFFFAILCFLFKIFEDSFFLITIFLCISLCVTRKKYICIPFFLVFVLVSSFSYYLSNLPDMYEVKVRDVHASYAEVQQGRYKAIVYTKEILPFDSTILVHGDPVLLDSSPSFYGYDFVRQCHAKHIYYAYSSYTMVKEGHSIRALLQKRCIDSMVLKVLTGISEDTFENFLFTYGFHLTSGLYFLSFILQYFFTEKLCRNILLVLAVILGVVYHFPLTIVQYILFRVLSFCSVEYDQKIGIACVCLLLLFPHSYLQPSFLFPMAFRICSCFGSNHKRTWSVFCGLLLQSVLFHSMNPLFSLLYSFVKGMTGMMYWIALGYVFINTPILLDALTVCCSIGDMLLKLNIYGSVLGEGLLAFLCLCLCFRKKRYCSYIYVCLLLLFQYTGAFHPFAGVTFINVGQGDSTLITTAFHQSSILIDTGKPNAYRSLKGYLQAQGITKLGALIITHGDEDHCGNVDALLKDFEVEKVIERHISCYDVGQLTLYDLNDVESDNDNNSSIVNYFQMNGIRYLMMGDADSSIEKKILNTYGKIEVDVLHGSHHGSDTGTSDDLLDGVHPSCIIFSSGLHNRYKHPSAATIQRVLKHHLAYMNTAVEGDIRIVCIGPINLIVTSNGKIGIIH